MNKAGIAHHFAKNKDYKATLEKIIKTNKCPFCPDNFKYHKKPILKTYLGWQATANSWPYPGTKHHFIFICQKHKTNFSHLTDQDFKAIRTLFNWVIKKYKIKGGALTLRFGDQNYTGATVSHLHFHLIVPKFNSKTKRATALNFPIG